MGARIGLGYRIEASGRGWVVHFRCVLGGLHYMASCGAWGLFYFRDVDSLIFVDTVLCSLLLLQSLDLLYRVVQVVFPVLCTRFCGEM